MSAPGADEEVLGRSGLPRWLPWGAGLVLAAVLAAVLVLNLTGGKDGAPAALPSSGPNTGAIDPPTLVFPPTAVDERDVRLPSRAPVTDVVTDGHAAYVLQGRLLSKLGGGPAVSRTLEPQLGSLGVHLQLDSYLPVLWVVGSGGHPRIVEVSTRSLRELRSFTWPRTVLSTAPLDGNLFVADVTRLTRINRSGDILTPTTLPSGVRPTQLAGDPRRDRLLMLADSPGGQRIVEIGESDPIMLARPPRDVRSAVLSVTGTGDVWVAGTLDKRPILLRLDPRKFSVTDNSPIVREFGADVVVRAAGMANLFISESSDDAILYCVSGETGELAQSWQLTPMRGSATGGVAYVSVEGNKLEQLTLSGYCAG